MAQDQENPFAGISTEGDAATPESGFNAEPMTASKRLIINNFFDTNEKQRKAFINKLGWELDPLDDNLIRPIGSEGGYIPIDPGYSDVYKKGGLEALGKEIALDMGDIAYDLTDFGQRVIGGVAGAVAGAGVASVPTSIAGAAAAGALSNTAKQQIREYFMDEDLDFDLAEAGLEAGLSAVGAGVFKLGANGVKMLKNAYLATMVDGIKNSVKKVGALPDVDLVEKAARNPEMFTKEAVEGGTERFSKLHDTLFGLSETETPRTITDLKRIRPDSYFGEKITPMFKAREQALDILANDSKAGLPYKEAIEQLDQTYNALASKIGRTANKTDIEALDTIGKYMKNMKNIAADNIGKKAEDATEAELSNATINFKQARQWLDSLQDDAFDKATKSQNPVVNQAAGGMRQYLDNKAIASGNEMGQQFVDLNAKMSEVLKDYDYVKTEMRPGKMVKAFVGGSTPASRAESDKLMLKLAEMDEKYQGSTLVKDFGTAIEQSLFENVYKNTPAKGSARVNAMALAEGGRQAMKFGALGAGAGSVLPGVGYGGGAIAGLVYGGAKGLKEGAEMAVPEVGLSKLGTYLKKQAMGEAKDLADSSLEDSIQGALRGGNLSGAMGLAEKGGYVGREVLGQGAAKAAGMAIGGVEGETPEEENPFAGINP